MHSILAEYLKRENVRILNSVRDWREAIEVSTRQLIEQGFITERYPQRVLELTVQHGSYYVVGNSTALVHARPEDGVIRQQLAVTVLQQPVYFDDKPTEPVHLFIPLCAESNDGHLELLKQLAELMMDESRVKKCMDMHSERELYSEIVGTNI